MLKIGPFKSCATAKFCDPEFPPSVTCLAPRKLIRFGGNKVPFCSSSYP
jgi:hypothetical protein